MIINKIIIVVSANIFHWTPSQYHLGMAGKILAEFIINKFVNNFIIKLL